jgi:hypothetical protein
MIALDFALGPSYEVVIAGRIKSNDTKEMLEALRAEFIPNIVVLHNPEDNGATKIPKPLRFIEDYASVNAKQPPTFAPTFPVSNLRQTQPKC